MYLDDRFIGVIGIEMDYSFMTEQVDNITLYDNGYAFVNDAEGKIIYHPRMDVIAAETLPEPPAGIVGGDPYIHYTYEGVEKVGVSLPLANGDRLNVSVPLNEINAGWQRWIIKIVVAFVVLLAAFVIFITRFTRRIT